jgi:hypothetical protein
MYDYLRPDRIPLEHRVRVLATRLELAEEHIRLGRVDGRDWNRRRDYLVGWLDMALFDLYNNKPVSRSLDN